MAIYLNEDEVGTDNSVIGYPHLLLCMGLTLLMRDGKLIGGHFTKPSSEQRVADKIVKAIQANGSQAVCMYLTGNFYEHVQKHGGADYTGKSVLIGYKGDVRCYDTQQIKPKDGTFVRLTSLHPNATDCLVEYKREERVKYTDTTGKIGSSLTKNPKKLPLVSTHQIKSIDTVSGTPLHVVKTWTYTARV